MNLFLLNSEHFHVIKDYSLLIRILELSVSITKTPPTIASLHIYVSWDSKLRRLLVVNKHENLFIIRQVELLRVHKVSTPKLVRTRAKKNFPSRFAFVCFLFRGYRHLRWTTVFKLNGSDPCVFWFTFASLERTFFLCYKCTKFKPFFQDIAIFFSSFGN